MDPAYERFLQSKRNNEIDRINKKNASFDRVSLQIRKGVPLDSIEEQIWARQNFVNFKEKEKEEIVEMFRRRNNMRLFLILFFSFVYASKSFNK